ncbi:MAG: hypothetical protein P8Y70_02095 [Candidatus Lokiarchaeota archaeon]
MTPLKQVNDSEIWLKYLDDIVKCKMTVKEMVISQNMNNPKEKKFLTK